MGESVYTYQTAQEATEKRRLDELYVALREYLSSQVPFAHRYTTPPPKRILELGCGSGAWAIAASNDHPHAEVIAVDSSPTLEGIPLPKNLKFRLHNVSDPFPFEPASFDVVHARFLFIHVPNARDALTRAAALVKPGGWLLLEDINMQKIIETGGPAISRVTGIWTSIVKDRGADACFGREMESTIRNTGAFSEIHTKMVALPVCESSGVENEPPAVMRLAAAFKLTILRLVDDWTTRFADKGVTPGLGEKVHLEINDTTNDPPVLHELHFVWARRDA
ncbi:S-adenosyl-L-methionine-dependent methyltransferase [Favolaschia claudopus]|uniref:S-adenosyl-L-methionine-dependent methyltransferase n=1 Tax=Favolaschia claudopus TaxID=2862362 RepID=A0AAW0CMD9_9AGAR